MRTIEDTTPLNGGEVDVASRIGWVLRMARLTAEVDDVRLSAIAQRLGCSTAHVSRVETGQRRDGELVTGYERALGLPDGSLRAPVEVLCRTYPRLSPRDHAPGAPVTDVVAFSRLTEELLTEAPVSGGQWLRWARELSRPGNISLPAATFRLLCRRLVQELGRSVGHALPSRYEALALLRCSAYGPLVLEAAREVVADPYAQSLGPLLRAVGQSPADGALEWCLELLTDPVDNRVRAAADALETMGTVGGPEVWPALAPQLLEMHAATEPGSLAEGCVAHLIRTVPRQVWQVLGSTPARALPRAEGVESNPDFSSGAYRECVREADAITSALGLPNQPMLARLLYDVALGPWETRSVTGQVLLGAVPRVGSAVTELLAAYVELLDPSPLRDRFARRLAQARNGVDVARTEAWLTHPDVALRHVGLVVAAGAGRSVPEEVLRAALLDPRTTMEAAYAAGMAVHPALEALAADPAFGPTTRGTLAWWSGRGGRLTD